MEVERATTPQHLLLRRTRQKPTTVYGLAQTGDVRALQKKLSECPSLINVGNPIVSSSVKEQAVQGLLHSCEILARE